ncbi:MAG: glycine cleavage system protein GcvH [Desulfobacterota bacterium]|nr:glycine cleavage system protein GcvH [Thermodesulfobacteriota bacterium]
MKYTKTHEWVKIFKNGRARVGVTDYAQRRFGKVLFVELPEIDNEYEQFDSCAVIEADNTLSEVYAPLSGRVIAVNEELEEDPTIINHDPYGDGWMLELELLHRDEIESLMDYDEYKRYLEQEADAS